MKMVASRQGSRLRVWFYLLVFIVLLMGVTGWFVARTDGFRQLAAERLTLWAGTPIEVEESLIGWPYELVLRGVGTPAGTTNGTVRGWVREVRIGRSLRCWRVAVLGAMLQMPSDVAARTVTEVPPLALRVARLRHAGARDIMQATAEIRRSIALDLRDVDLLWVDSDGSITGRIPQLQFQMEPVRLPSGPMVYYQLVVPGHAQGALGDVQDLRWEWLSRREDHYVEITRRGMYDDAWAGQTQEGNE